MRRPQHCCVSQLPLTTPVQTASKNSKRLAINALERQLVCPDAGRRAVGDGISRRDLPRPVTDQQRATYCSAQSKCEVKHIFVIVQTNCASKTLTEVLCEGFFSLTLGMQAAMQPSTHSTLARTCCAHGLTLTCRYSTRSYSLVQL